MDDLGDLVVRPARVVVDGLCNRGAGLDGVGAAQEEGEAAERRPAAHLQLVESLAQDLVGIVDHHGLRVIQGGDPALAVRVEDLAHHAARSGRATKVSSSFSWISTPIRAIRALSLLISACRRRLDRTWHRSSMAEIGLG